MSSSWMTPRNFSMLLRKSRISRAVWLSREVRWSTALRGRTITRDILSLAIDDSEPAEAEAFDPKLLNGVTRLKVKAFRKEIPEGLYSARKLKETPCTAYAVPYYSWGEPGAECEMPGVWMSPKHLTTGVRVVFWHARYVPDGLRSHLTFPLDNPNRL